MLFNCGEIANKKVRLHLEGARAPDTDGTAFAKGELQRPVSKRSGRVSFSAGSRAFSRVSILLRRVALSSASSMPKYR